MYDFEIDLEQVAKEVFPVLEDKEATPTKETQIITPSEEYYGMSSVIVNPIPNEYQIVDGEINITENGSYDVSDKATANVDIEFNLQSKTITPTTSNQIITPDENYDGLSSVEVNAIPSEYIVPTGTKEITTNGTYDIKNYESANVNVPANVGTKTITENGVYNASDDNLDGYSSVNVETSGADLSEYFTETITSGTSSNAGWTNTIKKIPAYTNIGTSCDYYFYGFKGTEIDLSNINTSNSTSLTSMFTGCTNLRSLDVSNFNTSKVTNMYYMFRGCSNLTSLDVSNFDTSNVKNMEGMFYQCSSLTSLDLSSFNTSNVTRMTSMFDRCINLLHLDIRNFDFTKVTSYSTMFGLEISNNVPADCLIIVKDETAKTWITEKFTRLTNVKTVAEYEG